jgi:hypothetical protein
MGTRANVLTPGTGAAALRAAVDFPGWGKPSTSAFERGYAGTRGFVPLECLRRPSLHEDGGYPATGMA